MKVALVQHDVEWEDAAANHARLAPMIAGAARDGAKLIVLTEMFATGFSMATERIAESFDGPSACFLAQQAREHRVWVCGSVPERGPDDADDGAGAKPGNVLIFAAPDGALRRYTKIHPFSYAGEHERFRAGNDFLTLDVAGVRVTGFVCYDLRFADEFWAVAPDTDAYVVVANWPAARRDHWRALLLARAIENEAYVVGVNRVGDGGGTAYVGDSLAVSPWGEVLADGEGAGERVLFADLDPEVVNNTRKRYPFLNDRR
jgi:predicted amidohydrolase